MAIKVARAVYEGIEAVRASGLTNMLDRPRVRRLASEMGFEEAAEWLGEHPGSYATAIFNGMEPDDITTNEVQS